MRITDVCLIGQEDAGYRALVCRRIAERNAARCDAPLPAPFAPHAAPAMTQGDGGEADAFHAPCAMSSSVSDKTTEEPKRTQVLPSSCRSSVISVCDAPARPAARALPPVGKQVEKAVRQLLGCAHKLENKTVLTWREREDMQWERRYAELDAVHRVDYDTLVIYEIKFITPDKMCHLEGLYQLDKAAFLLQSTRSGRCTRRRLVYVGAEQPTLCGIPAVSLADVWSPLGIIWVSPQMVEAMAADGGTPMPEGWQDRPEQARQKARTRNEIIGFEAGAQAQILGGKSEQTSGV